MARYVLRRMGSAGVTLFAVSLVVFGAIHSVPGGYVTVVLGPYGSPDARAALAEKFGLNVPLPEQYVRWLAAALQGDLGLSLMSGLPVTREFARYLPPTIELAIIATAVSAAIGIPIAIASSWPSTGRRAHLAGRVAGAAAMSIPDFVIGTALVYIFSTLAIGLTVGGYKDLSVDPVANLRSIILPAATLSVFGTALVIRTGRDAVLSVVSQPHMVAAFASGQRSLYIIRHHLLRNTAIPLITVMASNVGYLLGGATIVERLFSVPGMGFFMFNAISHRDYGVVQAGVMLGAAIFVLLNTLADLSYGLIDPRIRNVG
jgi:peptide/nickel transport system permease protein